MKKLKLDFEALEVESFDTTPNGAAATRGTVFGQYPTIPCQQCTLNNDQLCTDACTDYCTEGGGETCSGMCPSIVLTCQVHLSGCQNEPGQTVGIDNYTCYGSTCAYSCDVCDTQPGDTSCDTCWSPA